MGRWGGNDNVGTRDARGGGLRVAGGSEVRRGGGGARGLKIRVAGGLHGIVRRGGEGGEDDGEDCIHYFSARERGDFWREREEEREGK